MQNITLQNVPDCAFEYVSSQYIRKLNKNIFLFLTEDKQIATSFDIFNFFYNDAKILKFPNKGAYDTSIQDRCECIKYLQNPFHKKHIIISSLNAVLQNLPTYDLLLNHIIELNIGDNENLTQFINKLNLLKYQRETFVIESGQFASRGDIVDIFAQSPFRIEFFDNTIESIRLFDPSSQKSIKKLDSISIYPFDLENENNETLFKYLPIKETAIIDSNHYIKNIPQDNRPRNISEYFKINFSNFSNHDSNELKFECNDNLMIDYSLDRAIEIINKSNKNILICAFSDTSLNNLKKILILNNQAKNKKIDIAKLPINKSFETKNNLFISEKDIFKSQLSSKKYNSKNFLTDLNALTEGDYVVHINHGIGKFKHLETIALNNIRHEFMLILFSGNDKLYLPIENINLISRYGSFDSDVILDTLGSHSWKNRKEKIEKKITDISKKLIETAALRELSSPFQVELSDEYFNFCNKFPYIETDDQKSAIESIENDLTSNKIMDRLICGDVGFGKTEIAIRAAYLVAKNNKQVVILSPTTILAKQHFESFTKRFEGTNIKICQLSRFTKSTSIKDDIQNNQYDIIIGTKSVLFQVFNNLGLLIIDEEQHFGVKDKEHIKNIKKNIHVLTLSATPIPRTLQLSLTGIRDLSLISTPPFGKIPTKTFLTDDKNQILIDGINFELSRDGQVFAVCPHISDLDNVANFITKNIPNAKIITAHSKLSTKVLENAIDSFINKQYNILLATNIIESGMDIASANTLVVFNAHMFGLANLYQLRGRVGRSHLQSFAYFTVPENKQLTHQAQKRLNIIKNMDKLGSGFMISTYDMDIRGAGNLLGEEQSGDLKEIGAELYQKMLQSAIAKIKDDTNAFQEMEEIKITLNRNVLIPESYIEDNDTRLSIYRRISEIKNEIDFASINKELKDRFGKIPEEVQNLFSAIKIQISAQNLGITKITEVPKGFLIEFCKFEKISELINLIQKDLSLEFIPSNKILMKSKSELHIHELFRKLQKIIAS